MNKSLIPAHSAPHVTAPRPVRAHVAVGAGLVGLLTLVIVHTVWAWRYFPMLLGDQGWYLQVAARLSQGEVLYRDVAWAYGPLPVQFLAALLRTLGPNAGLASVVNGGLAAASLLLTYLALRGLLRPSSALGFTAFAAIAGPYVGGDLIRLHLAAYSQAVTWGMTLSLAALVAAIRWQQTARGVWVFVAGGLAALAFLSKPEFGLSATGAVLAVLLARRSPWRAWASGCAGGSLVLLIGFGWQASVSGWEALGRGYLGYDMVSQGRFWGAAVGSRRWLASLACAWLGIGGLWVAWRVRRWRILALIGAGWLFVLALVLMIPVFLEAGTSGAPALSVTLGRILQWLSAVPWAPLTPILLLAAWPALRRHAPPAWWGLWAFAVLTNARLLLTGYSLGVAIAPALAVLWWLLSTPTGQPAVQPTGNAPAWPRWASMALVSLALVNLAAQVLTPGIAFDTPRRWFDTTLGPIAVPESRLAAEMAAIQAALAQHLAPGEPIFATGWGPGWYLLSGHANPTAFDAVLRGLGTGGAEAQLLQGALIKQPPAAVLVPVEQWLPAPPGAQRGRDRDAAAVRSGLASWWNRMEVTHMPVPFTDTASWVVLWRR